MRRFLLYCVLQLSISAAVFAQSVRVYIDRGVGTTHTLAIQEMCNFLGKSSSFRFSLDSVNRFNGSGIYITTTAKDTYRKAPAALKNMGAEGVYVLMMLIALITPMCTTI